MQPWHGATMTEGAYTCRNNASPINSNPILPRANLRNQIALLSQST